MLYWAQGACGNVAIGVAVTGYLAVLFPVIKGQWGLALTTAGVVWFFVLMNLFGPRMVARFEGWTLLIGLVPVLIAGTVGWLFFDPLLFAQAWNLTGSRC